MNKLQGTMIMLILKEMHKIKMGAYMEMQWKWTKVTGWWDKLTKAMNSLMSLSGGSSGL
jgi:hypothetical protein